ncbi:MAG: hypothetical protein WBD59_09965, partial [Candidatus Sulfotelmatobacter sp.]
MKQRSAMNSWKSLFFRDSLFSRLLILSFVLISHLALNAQRGSKARAGNPSAEKLVLRDSWFLQSSAKVRADGKTISTPTFNPAGWHHATVPTTVVAALVKDRTLPDPFFAMNLRQFPGVTYPIGGNFSNIAMQPDSPY